MKLKNIIFSYDTYIAIIAFALTYWLLPKFVRHDFCLGFYSIGITVLSIIFSIFFASLANMAGSSNDDFIKFLEEEKTYSTLLESFKFTLQALFIGLIFAIVAYLITDCQIKFAKPLQGAQHKIFISLFASIFTYGLTATGLTVKDSILYSKYRADFLNLPK